MWEVKQATKKGYVECEVGGVADLSYPSSKTRRGRVQGKGMIAPTICAESTLYRLGRKMSNNVDDYRVRKFTPLETWRLMGFSDEDFYKAEAVNSNTQLYKQAGNSIVKQCLIAIMREMMEVDNKRARG